MSAKPTSRQYPATSSVANSSKGGAKGTKSISFGGGKPSAPNTAAVNMNATARSSVAGGYPNGPSAAANSNQKGGGALIAHPKLNGRRNSTSPSKMNQTAKGSPSSALVAKKNVVGSNAPNKNSKKFIEAQAAAKMASLQAMQRREEAVAMAEIKAAENAHADARNQRAPIKGTWNDNKWFTLFFGSAKATALLIERERIDADNVSQKRLLLSTSTIRKVRESAAAQTPFMASVRDRPLHACTRVTNIITLVLALLTAICLFLFVVLLHPAKVLLESAASQCKA